MSGDFTRFSFRRDRHFSGVLNQQGRVTLDSDWNGVDLIRFLETVLVDAPEWTDFNDRDPGVTLLQLLTFLTESLLCQIDEQKRQRRRRRLAVLIGTAGIGLVLWSWDRREAI